MRKRILTFVALVPFWLANAGDVHAEGPHKLSVRQHPALPEPISNARIDEILRDMGTTLQGNCAVTFERFDDVATFGADELSFSINSEADFNAFSPKPGSVDVVGEINWCGVLAPNIIGCASRPGRILTVVRLSDAALEPLLWAHEFAHTSGSPHRGSAGTLMGPVLGSGNTSIDAAECNRLKAGSLAMETGVDASGIADGPPSGAAEPAGAGPTGTPEPVTQFAQRTWIHGTPYDLARQYTDNDVTPLANLLRDETQRGAWRHGVATLGAIGGERSKAVLLDFLLKGPDSKIAAEEYIAKSNVPVALGWLVRRSIEENKKDQPTLELLIKMTNGDWWTQTSKIDWNTPVHKNRESLIISLVTKAVIGLSLTGAPEAEARLKEMLAQTTSSLSLPTFSAVESAAVESMGFEAKSAVRTVSPTTKAAVSRSGGDKFLSGQIGELQRVREKGLTRYYQR